jgi:phenylacetate 2-hydroxylase
MDTYAHLRHIVFDLCLSLTYGARFGEVEDDFMLTFIKSINAVSAVRSSTKSFRHFVPLLRIIPEPTSKTIQAERIRRKHRDALYNKYKERVAGGEKVDCIVAALNEDRLTEEEVHGTCISLLQAAPDTVASGVYQAVAWLSTPEGRDTQEKALAAILEAYNGDRTKAWKMAFREERVPLISSINKETLRFYTFAPYATPRRSVADVTTPSSIVIPKGMTFIMNAQEVNHDKAHFGDDAWSFRPDRFVDSKVGLPHVAFGSGTRICPAVAISNRIIYALLTRLILAFEMKESREPSRAPSIHPIDFSDVHDQLVAHPRFYDCHFKTRDPLWLESILPEDFEDF